MNLKLDNYKHILRKRQYKRFIKQLAFDVRVRILGKRCPLCNCMALELSHKRTYLKEAICDGCDFDISLFRESPERHQRDIKRFLEWSGLTYEQFCKHEIN